LTPPSSFAGEKRSAIVAETGAQMVGMTKQRAGCGELERAADAVREHRGAVDRAGDGATDKPARDRVAAGIEQDRRSVAEAERAPRYGAVAGINIGSIAVNRVLAKAAVIEVALKRQRVRHAVGAVERHEGNVVPKTLRRCENAGAVLARLITGARWSGPRFFGVKR